MFTCVVILTLTYSLFHRVNYVADFLPTLIFRPTRIGNTSATLIDHIWSNCSNENVSSGIISCDVSDHFIAYATTGAGAVVPNDKYLHYCK